MKTVAVIGGGITGLSAMYYLQKLKQEQQLDLDLILIEKDSELGGKIRTVKDSEFIMENRGGLDRCAPRQCQTAD